MYPAKPIRKAKIDTFKTFERSGLKKRMRRNALRAHRLRPRKNEFPERITARPKAPTAENPNENINLTNRGIGVT